MCLLNILQKLKNDLDFEIVIAHINHGLREKAIDDENFVKNYAELNQIPIYIKRAKVGEIAKSQNKGLEETGRQVRYDFFEEVAKKIGASKIAIAHNSNDNVETIFMNVLRGSGINGLRGIEPIRNKRYIRPLIECSREEIEYYCEKNGLNPRIDETNKENNYTRNKIRNICIPYLKQEFNPNIIKSINRLAETAREESKFIEEIVAKRYQELLIKEDNRKEIILNLKEFNKLPLVIKRRMVIYIIYKLCGSTRGIQKIHIDDIIKMCENNIGNKYLTPQKGIKAMLKNKKIYFQLETNLP